MIGFVRTLDTKQFPVPILIFLFLTDLSIFFDIPLIRQICGFFFLTILPGLLILQILKLNKTESIENFVIAVGISITFLMLFGLLINNFSLSLGYETPLATSVLLISFNTAFIILIIIGYMINSDSVFSLPNLNLATPEKAFLIVPIFFPVLSIFGIHLMNTSDNNAVVMFLLFLISIYFIFVCFHCQDFPKRLYPIVIFLIGISLLLLMALRSNHIIGVDTHEEYYYFQTTLNNLYWSVFGHRTLDACLSISLLPTIYQSILNMSPEFLFKILYPILFSISPLVVYVISKKYIGESYGFIASFYFMTLHNFLWTEVHARTNIAILFFALLMMVFFNDNIDLVIKRLLFIAFMTSCMLSHYSTTYILFFILVGMFLGTEMFLKRGISKKAINLSLIIIFFVLIFFWYSQVTSSPFNSGVFFIAHTLKSLNGLFMEEMRSQNTLSMLGKGIGEKAIPSRVEFVLTWSTFALIGIGVVALIRKYKEMSFPELNFKKLEFLKNKFEVAYFVIVLECVGLFIGIIITPFVTVGYSLDRTYFFGSIVISVFFVIGGIIAAKYINKLTRLFSIKNKPKLTTYLIILLVLIPYFLCTTGVVYQAFEVPQSILLNSKGEEYDKMIVHDQDSCCAKWLGINVDNKIKIYTDYFGGLTLMSQGMVRSSIYDPSFIEDKKIIKAGFVLLRYVNVVEKKMLRSDSKWNNLTDYEHLFVDKSKIYDNCGSQVWR